MNIKLKIAPYFKALLKRWTYFKCKRVGGGGPTESGGFSLLFVCWIDFLLLDCFVLYYLALNSV